MIEPPRRATCPRNSTLEVIAKTVRDCSEPIRGGPARELCGASRFQGTSSTAYGARFDSLRIAGSAVQNEGRNIGRHLLRPLPVRAVARFLIDRQPRRR